MNRKRILVIGLIFISLILIGFIGAALFLKIDNAFKYVKDRDGLIILHHPGRYDKSIDWYQKTFDTYNDTIIGMEAYNQGDRYPGDRVFWDSINRDRTPYNYIWGFSNDDWHSKSNSFRNYQHFPMESLTENNLKTAMISGAFYFSYEPNGNNESSLTYGQAMTPKITNIQVIGTNITITGSNYDAIMWYNDQTEKIWIGESFNTSISTSTFVRAVLNNSAGLTYTQPFGLYGNMIFNPYSEVNWTTVTHYKANFHTHTNESDNTEPQMVINHYHSANYSILAITDHSKNTWDWEEYVDQQPVAKASTSEYYPLLDMLAVSGNEASNSHHFSTLFTDYDGAATDLLWNLF